MKIDMTECGLITEFQKSGKKHTSVDCALEFEYCGRPVRVKIIKEKIRKPGVR